MTLVRSITRCATLGLAAVAACEYDARVSPGPAAARGPEFAARATDRGGAGANGRHIVTFRAQVPADFDAQVEKMGGKVLWASPGSRLAAVRGLSAAAAAALAGNQSIAAVDADVLVSLEMPKLSAIDAGDVAGHLLVPGFAGMAELPYRRFLFYNVLGGASWAIGFVLLGYVAGDGYRRPPPRRY